MNPDRLVFFDEIWAKTNMTRPRGRSAERASAGARVVYLPPNSPDLNPIELVFSKFKWLLKSASARTVEALWSVCGDALNRFTEAECRSCFKHGGYRYTESECARGANSPPGAEIDKLNTNLADVMKLRLQHQDPHDSLPSRSSVVRPASRTRMAS